MHSHLCTREAFMIDALEAEGTCPICMQKGKHLIGWVEIKCCVCNKYFCLDEGLNIIVRERRKLLGLSRKEMCEKYGCTRKTLRNYENWWPSKKYYEATGKMVSNGQNTSN